MKEIKFPKDTTIISCDPGFSGGIAVIDKKFKEVHSFPTFKIKVGKNKETGTDKMRTQYDIAELAKLIKQIYARSTNPIVVIEKVSSAPGDGRVQAFAFGDGFGLIRGMFTYAGADIIYTTPATWKKTFFAPGASKEQSRLKAIELFPELKDKLARKKDEGLAESLLIGYYAREKYLE